MVRLFLEKLRQPERAFELTRRTGSADAARQVADFCRRGNNVRGAIEFLLMANQSEEVRGRGWGGGRAAESDGGRWSVTR